MKECSKCRHCYDDNHHICPLDDTPLMVSLTINLVINDRYTLEKRLGKGGMGIVFKAKHKFLKSSHAIKVILPNLSDGNDDSLLVRFKQEAVLAASIDHPNVIRVTDFGVENGIMPYLVMEFIDGIPLSDHLVPNQNLPVEQTLEYFKPIALAVSEAHKQGIVHRDLKPQNIMVQKGLPMRKAIKVLDFGLAKIKSADTFGSLIQAKTLSVLGSPPYMPPEQWESKEVDHQTDIYALGVLLYQMLTGRLPFEGDSVPAIMYQHLTAQPPTFESINVNVSAKIEEIVNKALHKESDQRYQSVEEMLADFENAVENPNLQKSLSNTDTEVLPLSFTSTADQNIRENAATVSDALSNTQKEKLSQYFDSSEKANILADTQLAQEFLVAQDRVAQAEERVSEADKLVNEFAEAEQFAQDAQRKALEAKQKIEQDIRRRVEAEWTDKMAVENQSRQKAEAERLAKESEARQKAEEEAHRLAQVALEAQQQAEIARKKAEEEIQQRAMYEDVRIQAEQTAQKLTEQVSDAKKKYEDAQRKAAYEAELRVLADVKRQKIESELQAVAANEAERRKLAEAEVQRLIQEQSSRYEEEAFAAQKTIEDAKRLAELESRKREEAEAAKIHAEAEAQKLAEEMRRVQAHIEEIKLHSSVPSQNTADHNSRHNTSASAGEDTDSMHTISDANKVQFVIDGFSADQSQEQSLNRSSVPSNQNISHETISVKKPADSNQNLSGFLNTGPIEKKGFPVVKVLAGVVGLFFVLVIGSTALYFLAVRDSGTTGVDGNQNTETETNQSANQPPEISKPGEKERVLINSGSFKMGRDDVPPTAYPWGFQYPAHEVSVDSFLMDKTEVSNAEYAEFVKDTKRPAPNDWSDDAPRSGTENQPVSFVNLDDAQAFAEWVSKKDGKECRLPTEMEWEFAIQNGSQQTTYPWGNEWQPEFAILSGKAADVGTSKDETSEHKIKDLFGNVLEWTSSKAGEYPGRNRGIESDLQGYNVVRGSSWGAIKSELEKSEWLSTRRQFVPSDQKSPYLGFRLVCQQ